MTAPLLEVRDLRTYLFTRWGVTHAVDGVNLSVLPGETLGIVGESGSGKSMLAASIVRLIPKPAARIVSGQVRFNGQDLLRKSERELRAIRGSQIAMILQDPHQSLNPVYSLGNQLAEAVVRDAQPRPSVRQRMVEVLRQVRVPAPERRLHDYPHQLSGGMKQRMVGAMAIARQPRLLIADEPTTALDVTVQAQYLRLLKQLQRETGVALIIITHDFGVVAQMCDRVAVMYAGRIIEQAPVEDIFDRPAHPYTRALLAALPRIEERVDHLVAIDGQPPALYDLPPGCRFAPRCPRASAHCSEAYPAPVALTPDHTADCWHLPSPVAARP